MYQRDPSGECYGTADFLIIPQDQWEILQNIPGWTVTDKETRAAGSTVEVLGEESQITDRTRKLREFSEFLKGGAAKCASGDQVQVPSIQEKSCALPQPLTQNSTVQENSKETSSSNKTSSASEVEMCSHNSLGSLRSTSQQESNVIDPIRETRLQDATCSSGGEEHSRNVPSDISPQLNSTYTVTKPYIIRLTADKICTDAAGIPSGSGSNHCSDTQQHSRNIEDAAPRNNENLSACEDVTSNRTLFNFSSTQIKKMTEVMCTLYP